jgi:hypothetical protein
MATYASKGDRLIDKTIQYRSIENPVGTTSGRGLSPNVWEKCPIAKLKANPQEGMFFFDDFTQDGGIVIAANTNTAAASALGTTGKWTGCTAATAGTTVSTLATNYQGVVHLESTTDNEDCIIAYPKTAHTAGIFKAYTGTRLWMEARVSVLNITNSRFNAFFGFAEEGLVATTTLITASDAMADKDYIGFQRVFSDGDRLDTVYNTAGGATSPAAIGADAVTMEADTFKKIGLYCDGTTIYFFADGLLLPDSLAIATADFPDGEEMAFYAGLMLGHGDTASIELDWVAIAQEY